MDWDLCKTFVAVAETRSFAAAARQLRSSHPTVGRKVAELVLDSIKPFVELVDRARVQRRKRSDDAGLALGNDQLRPGHDEQRRADHGQFKRIGKRSRQRHSIPPVSRQAGRPERICRC